MVRPTFMGMETMKSAIFANQKSLDIVGNNISNLDTTGYTRQRVDRTSVSQSYLSTRVASNRVGLAGQGVEVLGVSQVRDAFLDKRFREEYSKASYHSQASGILNDIQSALGDGYDITDESGLTGAFQQIYESINDYSQDSTMDAQANLVMAAFKNMAQVLQQLDSKLQQVAEQQIYDTQIDVDRVNDILEEIAHLNKTISQDATVLSDPDNEYFRPNELLDQRNLLLDELAGYGDISVTELPDGTVNVEMGGMAAVTGLTHNSLSLTVNNDQTIALSWVSNGEKTQFSEGSLLASQHFINGRGSNVQSGNEEPYQGILYYRDRLDTLANAIADVANHSIPVVDSSTGKPQKDANGNTVYKTLIAAKMSNGKTNAKVSVAAANISISDEWTQGGPGYFIYDKNQDVPNYAQKLSGALTGESYTFVSYGESFSGSFEEYVHDYLSKLGTDISYQEGRNEAVAKVADDFLDRRDEISGVSKDEETVDMLKYQSSFEAAARVMTTLDELLDVVINRMGRVGL